MTAADQEKCRRAHAAWIAGLTLGIEAFTLALRFGAGLESTRDTSSLAPLTLGLRIHHSYVGAAILLASPFLRGRLRAWALRIGAALVLSDLLHHFAVLWPITGSPHFDLTHRSTS